MLTSGLIRNIYIFHLRFIILVIEFYMSVHFGIMLVHGKYTDEDSQKEKVII